MNWARYNTFEELRDVALTGVHQEWRDLPRFDVAILDPLRFIYNSARARPPDIRTNFCPDPINVFRPLREMRPNDIKVVILGQDPYPRLPDAVGVAFLNGGTKVPMSLRNIHKNLVYHGLECGVESCPVTVRNEFDISPWLRRGVFLMNVTFTTEAGKSGAHVGPWSGAANVILNAIPRNTVALLLGKDAQGLSSAIRSNIKIEGLHPAERSGTFYKKNVFGLANDALRSMGREPVEWRMHE